MTGADNAAGATSPATSTPTARRGSRLRRIGRGIERPWPFFTGVLLVYAVARLFTAIVLYLVGLHQVDVVWFDGETGYLRMTVLWDSFWYRQIVEDGYPAILPHDPVTGKLWQNPWAFYPIFPMITRGIMAVTGGGFALVGSTVSLLFGAVAAVLMGILLRDKVGARAALCAVAIWATCITSATLQVAYTESIALSLLCGVLLALTKEKWWAAAFIALLTGLARPIAAPLGVVALVSVFLRWRRRAERPLRVGEALGMLAAMGACGVAALIWPFIVWQGTGVRKGYFDTMTAWRAYDGIHFFEPWWNSALNVMRTPVAAALALAVLVGVIVAIVAGPWARALGPQLRTWCLAYPAYLFAVLDPTSSIFRYVICLFPWCVVMIGAGWGRPGDEAVGGGVEERHVGGAHVARLTRRMRQVSWRRMLAWTVVWVLFGLVTQTWWIWEIWQFTPPSDNPP